MCKLHNLLSCWLQFEIGNFTLIFRDVNSQIYMYTVVSKKRILQYRYSSVAIVLPEIVTLTTSTGVAQLAGYHTNFEVPSSLCDPLSHGQPVGNHCYPSIQVLIMTELYLHFVLLSLVTVVLCDSTLSTLRREQVGEIRISPSIHSIWQCILLW